MTKILSTMSLIFLISIFLVLVNCEKPQDENYGVSQGNSDYGPIPGKSETMMPNFFQKVGSHFVKGWHGLKGLFGRKSNRREENIYGGFGREEKPKPDEKETNINKEYPEANYNNNNNNYGSGGGAYSQSAYGGSKGKQEGNQGYQVGVDERDKVEGDKGQKEDKTYGLEETSKPYDRIKGNNKDKDNEKKSPINNGNNNFETDFDNQNFAGAKQRSRRAARGRISSFRRSFQPKGLLNKKSLRHSF